MGWAVGELNGRDIGYGVPAICDHPDCTTRIDRGLAYACGGGVMGTVHNCGLFFCGDHLVRFLENDDRGGEDVCERCADGLPPFDPKPDVPEWIEHVLTDPSWQQWRDENPERVDAMRAALADGRPS